MGRGGFPGRGFCVALTGCEFSRPRSGCIPRLRLPAGPRSASSQSRGQAKDAERANRDQDEDLHPLSVHHLGRTAERTHGSLVSVDVPRHSALGPNTRPAARPKRGERANPAGARCSGSRHHAYKCTRLGRATGSAFGPSSPKRMKKMSGSIWRASVATLSAWSKHPWAARATAK